MKQTINRIIDGLSDYFAQRKGLLPLLGIFLVLLNGILQFIPVDHWFIQTNILLHLGVIIALVGLLLARAL